MIKLDISDNFGVSDKITCYGDSLLDDTGGTSPATLLKRMLPSRLVSKYAIGGQKAAQIACRQGGIQIRISLTGGVFTALTPIVLSFISTQFLSTAATNATKTEKGTVNGIPCTITRTATGTAPSQVEVYTITPAFSTTDAVPDNSIFIPDYAVSAMSDIQVLWMGRNDASALTGVDLIVDNCIAFIEKPRRVIVVGVITALAEITGTANYIAIQAHNAKLKAAYPSNYVEGTPPSADEMAELRYTPSAQDIIDLGNNVIPTGMRSDSLHLNTVGYQLFANRIYKKIKELKY